MAFTYLIGWSELDKWYYGVKFRKGQDESCLMTSYFTSSKLVRAFIETHGLPDVVQVRRRFESREAAVNWESGVLRRLDVIHNDRWLNRSNNRAMIREDTTPWNKGMKGYKKKGVAWNLGKPNPRSAESIEKQRITMTGKKRGPYNYTSPSAQPLTFRDKEYPSIDAARKDTGASYNTIKRYAAFA